MEENGEPCPARPPRVGRRAQRAERSDTPAGQVAGQGETQRQRATWGCEPVRPRPRPPRPWRWRRWQSYCSDPTAELRSRRLTHRLHAHELTMRVEQQVLGREGARVRQPTRTARGRHGSSGPGPPPACPSPGGPRSVGSKGGLFQAEIGPVDGQSLSGLPSGIQTEPAKKRSPAVTGGRGPHPGCSRRSPAPNGAQRAGPRWRPPSPHALLPEEQGPTFRTLASTLDISGALCPFLSFFRKPPVPAKLCPRPPACPHLSTRSQ